jgi:cytochrome bd-type quinol oxidase subunit 2
MAETVYLLCALTSVVCAIMLFRGYRASRGKLLFWSSLCFAGLALNNVLLFLDLVLVPQLDLTLWRSAIALVALMMLLIGLVLESR